MSFPPPHHATRINTHRARKAARGERCRRTEIFSLCDVAMPPRRVSCPAMKDEARNPVAHPAAVAEALNRRFRPALKAYFLRRIRHHGEAEDLTQEVLLRLAERGAAVAAERPDGYVFRIATNLLRDRGRRDKVRRDYAAISTVDDLPIEVRDPHRVMEAKQPLDAVLAILQGLPEKTRTIFVNFRLEKIW